MIQKVTKQTEINGSQRPVKGIFSICYRSTCDGLAFSGGENTPSYIVELEKVTETPGQKHSHCRLPCHTLGS